MNGKLLYIHDDGSVTTLTVGDGLKIENGVLMIDNSFVTDALLDESKLDYMTIG